VVCPRVTDWRAARPPLALSSQNPSAFCRDVPGGDPAHATTRLAASRRFTVILIDLVAIDHKSWGRRVRTGPTSDTPKVFPAPLRQSLGADALRAPSPAADLPKLPFRGLEFAEHCVDHTHPLVLDGLAKRIGVASNVLSMTDLRPIRGLPTIPSSPLDATLDESGRGIRENVSPLLAELAKVLRTL
jgi:hypothetical protein